jgi:tetratricopeptide (TPR) repeat protein
VATAPPPPPKETSANPATQNPPAPTPPPPADWTTTDGKTYKNVSVISHDAKNVTISHSDGTATFPISFLAKDIQKRIADDNVTASDWTVSGKTFHNVKVGSVDANVVHITYDGGVGTVPLADLPPDLQKKFNYDPNRTLRTLGRKEQALIAYDRALALKPDFYGAWYSKGSALFELGRYKEALTAFDGALALDPNNLKLMGLRNNLATLT